MVNDETTIYLAVGFFVGQGNRQTAELLGFLAHGLVQLAKKSLRVHRHEAAGSLLDVSAIRYDAVDLRSKLIGRSQFSGKQQLVDGDDHGNDREIARYQPAENIEEGLDAPQRGNA